MSAPRLVADRRIREAAHAAAPGLDVRGPVSRALAQAGLTQAGLTPPASAPRWTEPAPVSGLTADERRVHRLLLDALARLGTERGGGGLGFAERKRLEALDVSFIDAELAAMARRRAVATRALTWGLGGGVVVLPLVVLAVILTGAADPVPVVLGLLVALAAAGAALAALGAPPPRRQIYEALRELALVADPGEATSTALLEADLLIDRLAEADEAAAPAVAPRARARS